MAVLGFSSSAIKGGNVDRLVRAVLSGLDGPTEFVNLTELTYGPCRACGHLCAGDNLCRLKDDLEPLFPELIASEAIVLGTPTYFKRMNGFMSVFLERMWSLRHQRYPLEGRPYAVVAAGAMPGDAEKAIESVKSRLDHLRARFVGALAFHSGNFSCYRCGYGMSCTVSGLYDLHGQEGQRRARSGGRAFSQWEESPEIASRLAALVNQLKDLLK